MRAVTRARFVTLPSALALAWAGAGCVGGDLANAESTKGSDGGTATEGGSGLSGPKGDTAGHGRTDGSTGSGGDSESDTGGESWPECVPQEEGRGAVGKLGYGLDIPDWPLSPDPRTEEARCTIDQRMDQEESRGWFIVNYRLTCTDAEGNGNHPTTLQVAPVATIGDRLDGLVGTTVRLHFSVTQGGYHHFIALHDDATGGLLFLRGVTSGTPVSLPADRPEVDWLGPLRAITAVEGLCGPTIAVEGDGRGAPKSTIERFALEFETEAATYRVFDRHEEAAIATDDGEYTAIVGEAYHLLETTCSDCPQTWIDFLVFKNDL